MSSQFDITTQEKAEAIKKNFDELYSSDDEEIEQVTDAWIDGRNSAKESLEILARAVEHAHDHGDRTVRHGNCPACVAIAQVKRNGDWPLE